ncbi:MAG: MFS transporter [Eubacteriales bacterium]|nr:MFS transporter [Eubacteriales bacterium]
MKTEKAKNPNRLGFGRLMAWKSSDVVAAWIQVIMLQYLSIYASDTLGVAVGTVGTLLLASKIVDAFTDILAGWLVDNTKHKWGKGRPYELGIVGMTITTILLFSCSTEWSYVIKCVWIFSMYTLCFSIFSTLRSAALNPYTIRHFSNNKVLITKVASYGSIITMAGSMTMSIAFPIFMARIATSSGGWTMLIAAIMIPATLIGVLRFLVCKEDPSVDADDKHKGVDIKEIFVMFAKNKYVWIYAIIMLSFNVITNLAVGTYFFKWVIGNMALMSISGIVSIVILPFMFVMPAVARKCGSISNMIFILGFVGIIGYGIAYLGGASVVTAMVGMVLGNLATLPLSYYGVLFIMNICTYNEMIGLPRMDASSGILANFTSKLGAALGAWVTGAILSFGGYLSGTNVTAQPASAIQAIRFDFAIMPIICLVVIMVCAKMFSVLEKKVPAWEAEQKAKREAEAAASAE